MKEWTRDALRIEAEAHGLHPRTVINRYFKSKIRDPKKLFAAPRGSVRFLGQTYAEWSAHIKGLYGIDMPATQVRKRLTDYRRRMPDWDALVELDKACRKIRDQARDFVGPEDQ